MTVRRYANAQSTTLAASITASNTVIQVASASQFPSQFPYVLVLDPGLSTEEAVLVTSAVSTSLTVTRGFDSMAAQAHAAGTAVEHGVTAIEFREANEHNNATTDVHGRTGTLLDTDTSQSINGQKTFTQQTVHNGGIDTTDVTVFSQSLPRGLAAHTAVSAPLTGITTTPAPIVGIARTVVSGRRYALSTLLHLATSDSTTRYKVELYDATAGAVLITYFDARDRTAGISDSVYVRHIFTAGSSGAKTYQARVYRHFGSGSIDALSTPVQQLSLEDLGTL